MTPVDQPIDPIAETHYNVRNRVPGWLDIFEGWRKRSSAFRKTANGQYDIRYGDAPKSTMDLFLPSAASNDLRPVHIFIHGGYWQAMDKSDFSFIAQPFINADIACLIVNYDLCPDVSLYHIVDQMRDVVTWVSQNGESVGLDPKNIHISGHSAGGHLVGMLMTTDWQNAPNVAIKSAISLSGLFDLTQLVQTSINANVGLSMEDASALSPIPKKAQVNCPFLCVYGGAEGEGFAHQSQIAHDHFQTQGLDSTLIKLENANHFDVADALADPKSDIFQWALRHAT